MLSDCRLAESEWAEVMGFVELSINTTVASATREVPLKLDLGEVPRMPVDVIVNRQAAAV